MITIVDYGLGNVKAFSNVYRRLNIDTKIARSARELESATKILLPGVGAFDEAMMLLTRSGMRETLQFLVQEKKAPILGVCVGMQILAGASDEGQLPGLGWIPGHVRAFRSAWQCAGMRLPHMGWNDVTPLAERGLFGGIDESAPFYFLHSYFLECKDERHIAAQTRYGLAFASAVSHENVYGVQFHPEKSHEAGSLLLRNFAEAVAC